MNGNVPLSVAFRLNASLSVALRLKISGALHLNAPLVVRVCLLYKLNA
jgi:hypothetical protein